MQKSISKQTGLVLPGGGARGAYQVGVLKGVAELLPSDCSNPFQVISGTSAGAVNASVIAANSNSFGIAVDELEDVWSNFQSNQVYKTDNLTMIRSSMHWLVSIVMRGYMFGNPKSLLDNSPLRELLTEHIRFSDIQRNIDAGLLQAISVTAAGYSSQCSTSFFQSNNIIEEWRRTRRKGVRADITIDHLMASIAIPMIFPQVRINNEYFGDGAMRQATPLSTAIHLGADRILVIGIRGHEEKLAHQNLTSSYPSFAHIAGYMLDTLFMDGLYSDLERVIRINELIDESHQNHTSELNYRLRPIDTMIINPSQSISSIASQCYSSMPRSIRLIIRGISEKDNNGVDRLLSFLLFEKEYTKKLIDLGYQDAIAMQKNLLKFVKGQEISGTVNSRKN